MHVILYMQLSCFKYNKVLECQGQIYFKLPWRQLTNAHVSSLAACQCVLAAAGPGVDRNRFANDQTILHQFTDLLTWRKEEGELHTESNPTAGNSTHLNPMGD